MKNIKDTKIDVHGILKGLLKKIKPYTKKIKPTVGELIQLFELSIEAQISGKKDAVENVVSSFLDKQFDNIENN